MKCSRDSLEVEGMKKRLVSICVGLVVVALGLTACSKNESEKVAKEKGAVSLKEAQEKGPVKPNPQMRQKMQQKTAGQGGKTTKP